MTMKPAIARQNRMGVWLYNPLPGTAYQISSLLQWTPFFADSSLTPGSAVEMPKAAGLGPRSNQLVDPVISCSYPALIQRASQKEALSRRCCKCRAVSCKTCRSPLHMDNTWAECFLRQLRKFNLPQELLIQFYSIIIESILCTSITVWFSSATKSDLRRLRRVVRTAERIIGTTLPTIQELYFSRVSKRAGKITLDP